MGKNTGRTIYVGSEAFAEMWDATINNPASVEQMKKYFPQSYDIFLESVAAIE
jgi:hypothetical protein